MKAAYTSYFYDFNKIPWQLVSFAPEHKFLRSILDLTTEKHPFKV